MVGSAVLGVEDGTFGYHDSPIFEHISFQLNQERTALVGDNGGGKSTLLKCLAGQLELNAGRVIRSRAAKVAFVEQDVPHLNAGALTREVLISFLPERDRDADEWRIDVVFDELSIPPQVAVGRFDELSVGWQRLILIAGAMRLSNPDIVLLDEPTNHLDLGNICVLEEWIAKDEHLPMLIVSHDREFLDRMTTRTLFLRADGVHAFAASFSKAREELLRTDAAHAKKRQLEDKEIRRLEQVANRYRVWGQLNTTFHRRQKATEKRIERLEAARTPAYRSRDRELTLSNDEMEAKVALRLQNFTLYTPDQSRALLKVDNLIIRTGEKVALLGHNGSGKTTLLQLLAERAANSLNAGPSSEVRFNPQSRVAYLDQRMRELAIDTSIIDFIADVDGVTQTQASGLLAKAGFPFSRFRGLIADLSYGERARLFFLRLSLLRPTFYILDEPTNHLDIVGQEALESEFENPSVSCVFVSHDRFFTRTAASRWLEIRKGRLLELANADEYFQRP